MENIIEFKNIVKTYDMGGAEQVLALRGVSVNIAKNEYVAIMGPSGSGKSTLMNIIGCLDTPTSGTVTVGGQTKFACVDGPEFDGHKVDWSSLMSRLSFYKEEEKVAVDQYKHKCNLDIALEKEGK